MANEEYKSVVEEKFSRWYALNQLLVKLDYTLLIELLGCYVYFAIVIFCLFASNI